MNNLFLSIAMAIILLLLSACTANSNSSNNGNPIPEVVEAEIQLPEEIYLNTESILKVIVTQGQGNIEEADDVQFEIWSENNKEASEMIKANNEKNGIYSIKKTFQQDGIYYIQTHVTAKGLHVMPKKRFIVGTVSKEELNSLNEETKNQEDSNGNNSHHH
ncbi:FixH family protein [Radiobacillus kanasensis]|uniref:FixH family protein n=1 Tax=Radiobacillus kanasensis TaxID=2844358 RepID=UPI001E2B7150|nr:FixH family protein [Radiobacillus kanasensis]UFT99571.1 FixH family protein [Radiobacillus kanasensis]